MPRFVTQEADSAQAPSEYIMTEDDITRNVALHHAQQGGTRVTESIERNSVRPAIRRWLSRQRMVRVWLPIVVQKATHSLVFLQATEGNSSVTTQPLASEEHPCPTDRQASEGRNYPATRRAPQTSEGHVYPATRQAMTPAQPDPDEQFDTISTRPDVVMREVPIDTSQLLSFSDILDYERNPSSALHIYHRLSGLLFEFEAGFDALRSPSSAEMKDDVDRSIRAFNSSVGQEGPWAGCAACGEIFSPDDSELMQLNNTLALSHLERSEDYAAHWRALPPVYRAAHHTTEIDGRLYALAPQLVDLSLNTGYICRDCQNPHRGKGHTTFMKLDYGVSYLDNELFQASLPASVRERKLTDFNKMVLARSIQYTVHVKLYGSRGEDASMQASLPKILSEHYVS